MTEREGKVVEGWVFPADGDPIIRLELMPWDIPENYKNWQQVAIVPRATWESLLAEREWRPIAEAPKDKTSVIVYRPHFDGKYIPQVGEDYFDPEWGTGAWMHSRADCQPTHFKPFPLPPAPKQEKDRG